MFLKLPVIISIRFDENNAFGTIYIDIYSFSGGGGYMVHLIFLGLLFIRKRENDKNMTYTKIKFYIILINKIFPHDE